MIDGKLLTIFCEQTESDTVIEYQWRAGTEIKMKAKEEFDRLIMVTEDFNTKIVNQNKQIGVLTQARWILGVLKIPVAGCSIAELWVTYCVG